ncbi:MFS transporter, partial [Pseudomonas sp. CrR25]|nr:MFS transporter [Pseudomonas sp. CrR25]
MPPAQRLATAINAKPVELRAALCGFALFFCLFSGYFMLRPIREAMGIRGGVENLQWLFSATFLAMLCAVPLFAWLNSRVPRTRYVDWVYGFFIVNLLGFAALFQYSDAVWLARLFYVWLSVYNLFVVSVAWSLMADVFDAAQARRLFAFIAAGASSGGLAGPALGTLTIGTIGQAGLVFGAALLLGGALWAKHDLMAWRAFGGAGRPGAPPSENPRRPVPGNPFSGIGRVLASPYLLGVAAFVILLATASTFLYFEQARLVQ